MVKTIDKSDIKKYGDIYRNMVNTGYSKIVNIKVKYNKVNNTYTVKFLCFNERAKSDKDLFLTEKEVIMNVNGLNEFWTKIIENKFKTHKNLTARKIRKSFTQSKKVTTLVSALTTSELNATKKAIFEECVKGRDNSVWINPMTV